MAAFGIQDVPFIVKSVSLILPWYHIVMFLHSPHPIRIEESSRPMMLPHRRRRCAPILGRRLLVPLPDRLTPAQFQVPLNLVELGLLVGDLPEGGEAGLVLRQFPDPLRILGPFLRHRGVHPLEDGQVGERGPGLHRKARRRARAEASNRRSGDDTEAPAERGRCPEELHVFWCVCEVRVSSIENDSVVVSGITG